jgi:hypothetical protein
VTLSTPARLRDIKVDPAVIREVHQLHGSCRLRPALSFVALPGKAHSGTMVVLPYEYLMAPWSAVESHLSVLTPKPRRSPAGAYFFEKESPRLGKPRPTPVANW